MGRSPGPLGRGNGALLKTKAAVRWHSPLPSISYTEMVEFASPHHKKFPIKKCFGGFNHSMAEKSIQKSGKCAWAAGALCLAAAKALALLHGQPVTPLILRMARMALDPVVVNGVRLAQVQ